MSIQNLINLLEVGTTTEGGARLNPAQCTKLLHALLNRQNEWETLTEFVCSVMMEEGIDNFKANVFHVEPGDRKVEVVFRFVDGKTPTELLCEIRDDLRPFIDSKTLDLVRCGIGSNYGGDAYDNAMKNFHAPLVAIAQKHRKGRN